VIARSGFIALPVFIENIPVSCFPLFFQAVSNAEKPVRYTILVRIEREQWSVAIHPSGVEIPVKVVTGTREDATVWACSMIDRWIKMHLAQKH